MALAPRRCSYSFFFFNDTATTEIYTLSLHDALPISRSERWVHGRIWRASPHLLAGVGNRRCPGRDGCQHRSEEHTSELQSRSDLVCRLLLEKKNKKQAVNYTRLLPPR